jgi:bacterioferritin-associated ferredoxin
MIVCVCEGISDREIKANIQAGASSLSELGRRCRAGIDCGRCREMIRGMLGERAGARGSDSQVKSTAC